MVGAVDHHQFLARTVHSLEQPFALICRHDSVARAGDNQHRATDAADSIERLEPVGEQKAD